MKQKKNKLLKFILFYSFLYFFIFSFSISIYSSLSKKSLNLLYFIPNFINKITNVNIIATQIKTTIIAVTIMFKSNKFKFIFYNHSYLSTSSSTLTASLICSKTSFNSVSKTVSLAKSIKYVSVSLTYFFLNAKLPYTASDKL